MNTFNSTTWVFVLACLVLATTGYSNTKSEVANQKVTEAVASGNVQSVISSLPVLEDMWPQAIGEYFQSAEAMARFLCESGDDPTVQKALDDLFNEFMAKLCPAGDDLAQAATYFEHKQKLIGYYYGFEKTRYGKPRLEAIARFLGEVRERRIPDYQNRGTARPGLEILAEAGVFEASLLTNPAQIQAYEKAKTDNIRDMQMNGLQLALSSADWSITRRIQYSFQQFDYRGTFDEAFADEVARIARFTEEERKGMYFPYK